jgi:quinol monooxygenase YgiN
MVIATLHIRVPKLKIREVDETLRMLEGPTSVQPGCNCSSYYRDLQNECEFAVVQEWSSQLHLKRYLKSDLYKKLLVLIDFAEEQPDLNFYFCESRAGLELVKKVRGWD